MDKLTRRAFVNVFYAGKDISLSLQQYMTGFSIIDNANSTIDSIEFSLRNKDRKSTRLNSSHANISYAVFCLKKKRRSFALINTDSSSENHSSSSPPSHQ